MQKACKNPTKPNNEFHLDSLIFVFKLKKKAGEKKIFEKEPFKTCLAFDDGSSYVTFTFPPLSLPPNPIPPSPKKKSKEVVCLKYSYLKQAIVSLSSQTTQISNTESSLH